MCMRLRPEHQFETVRESQRGADGAEKRRSGSVSNAVAVLRTAAHAMDTGALYPFSYRESPMVDVPDAIERQRQIAEKIEARRQRRAAGAKRREIYGPDDSLGDYNSDLDGPALTSEEFHLQ
ncbi:hypothetical protein DL768_003942 [Monosporascus sp. mg162]|nr:hypothetical protein DL768_003942 [Monosporascus sp. mg162]